MEFVRAVAKKGERMRGYKKKKSGEVRGKLSTPPPLAAFGADAARSFADDATGEGGSGVRSRYSGAARDIA